MIREYLLVRALKGEITERMPFWFMRQAGRYLPEYRALRASVPSFLDLCFDVDKAAEVTLQPIRRFGMDAAILFSDILVIPHGLGVGVRFAEGEGPIVEQTITPERIGQLHTHEVLKKLAPVGEVVKKVRAELPGETALIGFAGSPWTVACYMLQGERGKAAVKEFATARSFAYAQPALMQQLIDTLVDATIAYLRMQIDAGVQAVQLFDSWSGLLTPEQFARWSIGPTQRIVAALKQSHPNTPIIGFAKGAGANLPAYAAIEGLDAIGVDQHTPMPYAIGARAHTRQAVQGNLDPMQVLSDGPGSVAALKALLGVLNDVPCVVNFGHGMQPQTPIAHVEALCETIKQHRRS